MARTIPKDATIADVAPTLRAGDVFVAQVRHLMVKIERERNCAVVARIGTTGQGIMPNFRIDETDGLPIEAYDGVTFKPFGEIGTRDANWGTKAMTLPEITALLEGMRNIKSKSA